MVFAFHVSVRIFLAVKKCLQNHEAPYFNTVLYILNACCQIVIAHDYDGVVHFKTLSVAFFNLNLTLPLKLKEYFG